VNKIIKKLQTLLVFNFILIGCSSTSTTQTDAEKKAEIFYSYGTEKLTQGEYTEALDHLIKAAELNPKDSKTQNNLGMAYFFKGKKDQARFHLEKALELEPKNSDARNNLASLLYTSGKIPEAQGQYNKILEDLVYPHQYRTHYNLALISLQQKESNLALEHLRKSIAERPDYCAAHFKMGEILREKHSFSGALDSFKESAKGECVSQPAPHYEIAMTLTMMRRSDQARIKFEEILEKFPTSRFAALAGVQIRKLGQGREEETAYNLSGPDDLKLTNPVTEKKSGKSSALKYRSPAVISDEAPVDEEIDDDTNLDKFESPNF